MSTKVNKKQMLRFSAERRGFKKHALLNICKPSNRQRTLYTINKAIAGMGFEPITLAYGANKFPITTSCDKWRD